MSKTPETITQYALAGQADIMPAAMPRLASDFHIYGAAEDLPEDLRSYLAVTKSITVFRHPLTTDFLPMALPMAIEDFITFRKQQALELYEAGKLLMFVFFHSRPFRMDILAELVGAGVFDDAQEEYWKIARLVWEDSEQPEDDARWRILLYPHFDGQEHMTAPGDREALAAMPDEMTLYRGVQAANKVDAISACRDGWSWSLSEKTASWFARRLLPTGMSPYVVKASVKKADVIAYLRGREEEEMIVDEANVGFIKVARA